MPFWQSDFIQAKPTVGESQVVLWTRTLCSHPFGSVLSEGAGLSGTGKRNGILKGAVDELISSPLKKIMFTSTDVDSKSNDSRDEDEEDDFAQTLKRE